MPGSTRRPGTRSNPTTRDPPRRGHHRRLLRHRRGDSPRAGRRRPPGRAAGPPRRPDPAPSRTSSATARSRSRPTSPTATRSSPPPSASSRSSAAPTSSSTTPASCCSRPFTSDQRDEHRRMVEVNLLGAMTATEVFLDQLRDGGGDIVNISSVAGPHRSRRQRRLRRDQMGAERLVGVAAPGTAARHPRDGHRARRSRDRADRPHH